MPKLSAEQKAKVAASIKTQYAKSKKYIPGKVARARALNLVLNKSKKK